MDDVDAVTGGAGQPPVRTGWSRRRRVLAGCALLVVLAAVPTVWERLVAAPHLRDPTTVPDVPVALVFGARVVGDRPTAFLASRLDLAANLFARRKVRVILVSGNDDGHGYDEPDVMRAYLVAHGVPADRTVVDRGGFDALCRANGVDGYGVGVDSASVGLGSTVYGYVREFFAAGKAMWDALVGKPVPAVLGPADPAVSVALDH
jgi:vancomycin permeability regulator SanA